MNRQIGPIHFKSVVRFSDVMMRDHTVHGLRILPGVFLIDLIFRALKFKGENIQEYELNNVLFIKPIHATNEYDMLVELQILSSLKGKVDVHIKACPVKNDIPVTTLWEDILQAELVLLPTITPDNLERIPQFSSTNLSHCESALLYAYARNVGIIHGDFMTAKGGIDYSDTQLIASVQLQNEAQQYLSHFIIHPVLLDFATMTPLIFLDLHGESDSKPFIPLFVRSVRILKEIGKSAKVFFTRNDDRGLTSDTLHADLNLYDHEDELCVLLKDLTIKKIRDAKQIHQLISAQDNEVERFSIPEKEIGWKQAPDTMEKSESDTMHPIRHYLTTLIANFVEHPLGEIDVNIGFYELGLNSIDLLRIVKDIEEKVGATLYPTLLFEYDKISALTTFLHDHYPQAFLAIGKDEHLRQSILKAAVISKSSNDDLSLDEQIAIIGISATLPGAPTLDLFWEKLVNGKGSIEEIIAERWHTGDAEIACKWGGIIPDIHAFDASFFNISEEQANCMDPHERLFLQMAWHAFEDAGYSMASIKNCFDQQVGVFVGAMWTDYASSADLTPDSNGFVSSWLSSIANRVSYVMDLQGPSLTIDTACSSSLYALHLATESLRRGECKAALVGGVNLSLSFEKYQRLNKLGLLSSQGLCRPFAEGADGYVPGEGVVAIIIKPLSAALKDKDQIYGLIRSSAISHTGKSAGYTVPKASAQTALIRQALARGNIDATSINYIEAHSVGSSLGDVIEFNALKDAFENGVPNYCAIGSLKSNIGHLEAASGLAGIIKVILCMRHKTLVPSLHCEAINKNIGLHDSPFYIPHTPEKWECTFQVNGEANPRRAGLSAFGAGGANAHVILEEYIKPRDAADKQHQQFYLIPVSAKTEEALFNYITTLYAAVSFQNIEDIAFTLLNGRQQMEQRLVFIAHSSTQLKDLLGQAINSMTQGKRVYYVDKDLSAEIEPLLTKAEKWVDNNNNFLPLEFISGRRISLPGYPFSKKTYWLNKSQELPIYTTNYQEAPEGNNNLPRALLDCLFIIISSAQWSLHETLSAKFTRAKQIIFIVHDNEKRRRNETTYHINIHDKDHYDWLFQEVERYLSSNIGILNLVYTEKEADPQEFPCSSLFYLNQLLQKKSSVNRCFYLFCYQSKIGQVHFDALLGFFRSLHIENKKLLGKVIRLRTLDETSFSLLDDEYYFEQPQLIVYEGSQRLKECYYKVSALPGTLSKQPVSQISVGGVYIITGGLGGIGKLLAQYLVEQFAAKVYLLGRKNIDAEQAIFVNKLNAISSCQYIPCDVTQLHEVQQAFEKCHAHHGRIQGIIHAAGIINDKLLVSKTHDEFKRVIAVKVKGVNNIQIALKSVPPIDWLMLFSSLSAHLGNYGQTDYGYANNYLDYFAKYHSQPSLRIISIAWPLWADGGMTIDDHSKEIVLNEKSMQPLLTEQGIIAFHYALEQPHANILLYKGDEGSISKLLPISTTKKISIHNPAPPKPTEEERPDIIHQLSQLLAELLHVQLAEIDAHSSFMELGLDSLGIIQFYNKIKECYDIDFPASLLFDHSDVQSLSNYFLSAFPALTASIPSSSICVPYLALERDSASSLSQSESISNDIAIIGMDFKCAHVNSPEELWSILKLGKNVITPIPKNRKSLHPETQLNASLYPWGNFFEKVACFDHEFFGISPREAAVMDPQIRLLLQSLYHCFQRAGLINEIRGSKTGMFVSACYSDYLYEMIRHHHQVNPHEVTGNAPSMYANRASYYFNLKGPSLLIDTACSSSLTSVHYACQALQRGECNMAVVAAVNLILSPVHSDLFTSMGALSASGKCHSFQAQADGFVPGEGVASILLKPLHAAEKAGDRILGIIKGSAVEHNGKTNSITSPQSQAQSSVIKKAWKEANINPRDLSYIETHGTGTTLGDPVEIEGLKQAFKDFAAEHPYCSLGTIKSNIGHTESTAGLAGIIKVLLSMQHQLLPGIADFQTINPLIRLNDSPLSLLTQNKYWEALKNKPRLAGVSAFGFGGANAHVIIQEHIGQNKEITDLHSEHLIILSSNNFAGLITQIKNLRHYLIANPNIALARLAYSLHRSREALNVRLGIIVHDTEQLLKNLEHFLNTQHMELRYMLSRGDESNEGYSFSNPNIIEKRLMDWVATGKNDWDDLYKNNSGLLLEDLPVYSFANDLHWFMEQRDHNHSDANSDYICFHQIKRQANYVLRSNRVNVQPLFFIPINKAASVFEQKLQNRLNAQLIDIDGFPSYLKEGQACVVISTLAMTAKSSISEYIFNIMEIYWQFLQKVAASNSKTTLFVIYNHQNKDETMMSNCLGSLFRTLHNEHRHLHFRVIGVNKNSLEDEGVWQTLLDTDYHHPLELLTYENGQLQCMESEKITFLDNGEESLLRQNGCYWLAGGMGGIGYLLASYLASNYQARLILTGRKPLSAEYETKLALLRQFGATPIYLQSDVNDLNSCKSVVHFATLRFEALEGVFNCAGTINKRPFLEKSWAEADMILQPKVSGSVHLDEATQSVKLKFFVGMSSLSTLLETKETADYSAANAFMNAFIQHRQQLVINNQRHGKSVSINWPFWQEGQMSMEKELKHKIEQLMGMVPMPTDIGYRVLENVLTTTPLPEANIFVAYGCFERIHETLSIKDDNRVSQPFPEKQALPNSKAMSSLEGFLEKAVQKVLKIDQPIAPNVMLEQYGFESITISEFIKEINQELTLELSTSSYYEYPTLSALTSFIMSLQPNHKAKGDAQSESCSILDKSSEDAIAIIGVAGKFPQTDTVEAFWSNMILGVDCISEIPEQRFHWKEYYHGQDNPINLINSIHGGFIQDVDKFSELLFNISPKEAQAIDPQQRLFLQTTWQCIEDAGYSTEAIKGKNVGVFVGASQSDYADRLKSSGYNQCIHTPTSLSLSMIANRVSYYFDWHGPSEVTDTACSSSLVSLTRAIQSLKLGECEMAIAGGVNLLLSPNPFIACSKAGMLSPEGRCKTFDQEANGYVRAEAIAAVLLKPLSQAVKDGDPIYCVIPAYGVSHTGIAQGFTVPNPNSQAALLTSIYSKHNILANSINYLEMHGTATKIGDPIEVAAMKKVFDGNDLASCGLGAVKTHIGHLEAAAGIVSVIKVVKALEHKILPANLNFNTLNPEIRLSNSPFYILDKTIAWPRLRDKQGAFLPRRAGVNSFGFGGVNAHLVMEEYLAEQKAIVESSTVPNLGSYLFLLSAHDKHHLTVNVKQWINYLDTNQLSSQEFIDTLYTLQVARRHLPYRVGFVVADAKELNDRLRTFTDKDCVYAKSKNSRLSQVASNNQRIASPNVQEILNEWLEGCEIAWALLWENQVVKRRHAPAYHFDGASYWIDVKWQTNPLPTNHQLTNLQLPANDLNMDVEVVSSSIPMSKLRVVELIKDAFSSILKLDCDKFDEDETYDKYGLDSLLAVEIVGKLETHFGQLSKTLLFKYQTINTLAQYLVEFGVHTASQLDVQIPPVRNFHKINSKLDVAIIGYDGLFPNDKDCHDLWESMLKGESLIRKASPNRSIQNPNKDRWGGYIDSLMSFDPLFFGISPLEAELMDPQQRLVLMSIWKTIEYAGYNPKTLRGANIGIFVACTGVEYGNLLKENGRFNEAYVPSGIAQSILANRVSYLFDFKGPSEPVNTACSSSLVAIHRALQSIQSGECDSAIVAGVSAILDQEVFSAFDKMGFMSPNGTCNSFSADAQGFVRAEGVVSVFLKPLQQAEIDYDYIHAVLKGSAINHGGKVHSLTVPNPNAQCDVICRALNNAEISSDSISYIEAHGTGTELGDPIEIDGLIDAFNKCQPGLSVELPKNYCGIGSIKSNIGHMEGAAGLAGLTKVLLSLQNDLIPATLHAQQLNAKINLKDTPFYILNNNKHWPRTDNDKQFVPRRAGISSFGFGGVNAHVIVEDYQNTILKPQFVLPIVILSAETPKQLREYVRSLIKNLRSSLYQDIPFTNLLMTLQRARAPMLTRLAMLVDGYDDLFQQCHDFLDDKMNRKTVTNLLRGENKIVDLPIQTLIEAKRYKDIATHWVQGMNISWDEIYHSDKFNRVPLPSYPFARDIYCITEESTDDRWLAMLTDLQSGKKSLDEVSRCIKL